MANRERRQRNNGLLANVTERDVLVLGQLKRAGVVHLELGELRVSFDAYAEVEQVVGGDDGSIDARALLNNAADDDCENDHSGFEVVKGRPDDDEIN